MYVTLFIAVNNTTDHNIRTVSFAKLVYWSFGQSNMHFTLNFYPDQPKRNQMYQSKRVAKVLLILLS